jgi:hypothetical protein
VHGVLVTQRRLLLQQHETLLSLRQWVDGLLVDMPRIRYITADTARLESRVASAGHSLLLSCARYFLTRGEVLIA